MTHVYFPTTALVSLLTVMEEESPVEAATVGKEGILNVIVSLGIIKSPNRTVCQMSGDTFRLTVAHFLAALEAGTGLSFLIQRYIAFSLRAAGQLIACNALHSVESRASKWLLVLHDQSEGEVFPMTHEFLAYMLGVRRQSVTEVAVSLQGAGLITYRRGSITVIDRPGLETASCECYAAIRRYYESVIP